MSQIAYVPQVPPSSIQHHILCPDCGTPVAQSPSSEGGNSYICLSCLRTSTDITAALPKSSNLSFCRGCSRYLNPGSTVSSSSGNSASGSSGNVSGGGWVNAELESRELMSICLRKLGRSISNGRDGVRLIDAGFLWTEPHSRRIKVKLTVQKEVVAGTVLQQIFTIEYLVSHVQCPDCSRLAAKQTWKALVQVRQKVNHKKTFLYLEQLILKYNADRDTLGVKERKDGLDFHYASKGNAAKMAEFLMATVPARLKTSEQLISLDIQNSTTNSKTTFSVEIVPICKDDLLCLPLKLSRSLSNISQLVICTRINQTIHLIDPFSLKSTDLTGQNYWRTPFNPLAEIGMAVEFVVLDIEPTTYPPVTSASVAATQANGGIANGSNTTFRGKNFILADAQVSPVSGNMGSDTIFHTRTHLGAVLKPGDTVLGYHLGVSNFNNDDWERLNKDSMAEVVLVKKTYPNRTKKGGANKARHWKLRRMVKEEGGGEEAAAGPQSGMFATGKTSSGGEKVSKRQIMADQAKAEAEYENFLRDLEEDEEMRAAVNLYKTPGGSNKQQRKNEKKQNGMDIDMEVDGGETETASAMEKTDDEEDGEEDMPRIRMDELLDDVENLTIDDVPDGGEGNVSESQAQSPSI